MGLQPTNGNENVGRSPWTARDPLVAPGRTRGSGAGEGARPT